MFTNVLKDKSIEGRLLSGFLFLGLLVFTVALVGLITVLNLSEKINVLSNNSLPSIQGLWKINEGQTQIESSERALSLSGLSEQEIQTELTRIQTAWKQIDEGFEQYDAAPRTKEEEKLYDKLKEDWDKWKQAHETFLRMHGDFNRLGISAPTRLEIELLRQGQNTSPQIALARQAQALQRKLQEHNQATRSIFEQATADLLKLIEYNQEFANNVSQQAFKSIKQSWLWSIVALLIGPVTAYVLGRYFVNTIAKPLGMKIAGVVDVAEKISAGDLSSQIQPSEETDEIGKLQRAFYAMNRDLNALIAQIQASGVQITTSTTQISASGKELEATVTEQLASTNEVTATAHEIAATSKNLVRMMEQVAAQTQVTAGAARDSQDELEQMGTTMRNLTDATNSITSKLGIMNKKAGNINNMVITITKVADQTSILSLNAAIEAEKAGEYGAGFAVVAREIRRLANQTAVATLEIEQIVKDMQSAVTVGVMEMDKFSNSVSDTVTQVSKISQQIAKVIQQVQSLPPQLLQAGQSMEEQSQGAQQISEAMGQLSEASHQTVEALRESNKALEHLDEAAFALREEISRFKVNS
jgi:methyl-accepting chemotaxis protein WspA